MKFLLFTLIFILFLTSVIIYKNSDFISEKLTYNLNRNLDVDWGDNHHKFSKKNLVVDLLEMSISWDFFNILFPNTKTAMMINSFLSINSNDCISKVKFLINFVIDIRCNKISINYHGSKWGRYRDFFISHSFFFERRVFDDLHGKQGNLKININTRNLFINKKNHGQFLISYFFLDNENLKVIINGENFIITKKNEGLRIKSSENEFFFLNKNFFKNL